ncbi:MAG: hypothetical protein ALECFALPRED_001360 [Alectoria fallacina]|uniref:Heterokaryon incompatibility domain-containing protein n=1 Tax=Alectoria fallacina TaxID=1903189 RepID=A0A8H3EFJ4_9LECA|nr:MAG: hypothetical protein ALECFALPRED_001360 [Alectoria fallacina]
MTTDHLCHVCAGFDIRALYELAVLRVRESKPIESTTGGFSTYEGFPGFYKHHHNLQSLSTSAQQGCSLCTSIWQQCAKLLPVDIHARRSPLPIGQFGEQITLGLSNWSPEAEGMPYLTAVQQMPRGAITNLATFDVFVEPGRAPTGFETMLARSVQNDTASEASLKVAKTWHQECLASHQKCTRTLSQNHPLPTRVMDVGDAPRNPRLIVTDGQSGSWAALSYCWGGNSTFVLNKETSENFFGGKVPLYRYPKTLRDAITVTRALGLQFLWIDALSIMQDSAEDWATEAEHMKEVYGGAAITIAASSSTSTDYGIFKTRPISPGACKLEWRSLDRMESHNIFLRSSSEFWDTTMKNEPLNTRGWTLQESLLTPRTLSYGTQQMIWECLERKVGECGRPVLSGERHRDKNFVQTIMANNFTAWEKTKQTLTRLSLKTLPTNWTAVPESWWLSHDAMYSRWFAIVKDYTGRSLTVQSDILPALSGLASAFQNLLRDEYCAGLWKNDTIRGMCWMRSAVPKRDFRAIKAGQKERDDYLPSWSWASVTGGRVVNQLEDEQTWPFVTVEETAHILHMRTTPLNKNSFGQIAHAEIVIKAPFRYIDDPKIETSSSKSTALPVLRERVMRELQIHTSQDEFEQQHRPHRGQKFAVLRLMQTSRLWSSMGEGKDVYLPGASILILESTGEADKWRRVGFFSISVPAYPDADDLNVQFLDEMKRAKWEWRKVIIV